MHERKAFGGGRVYNNFTTVWREREGEHVGIGINVSIAAV